MTFRSADASGVHFALTFPPSVSSCLPGTVTLTRTATNRVHYVWTGTYSSGTAARSEGTLYQLA